MEMYELLDNNTYLVVCTHSGQGFKYGTIYAMAGWNNGHYVIRTDERGCYIQATRVSDGLKIQGTCVTMAMAKAEDWTKNPKWFSMTDQMLGYRASSFFARIYCPAVLMGVAVEGEIEDITQNRDRKVVDVL